jgi:hypothetical protein
MASTSITYLANAHPATAYQAAGDSLTFPEEALSIGYEGSVSIPSAIRTTGL